MKLSKAIEKFELALEGEVSPHTQIWYVSKLRSLGDFLGDPDVESVTIDDLRRYRAYLLSKEEKWENHPYRVTQKAPLSKYTVHGYVKTIRRFFHWLVDEGVLNDNPASRLGSVRLPDLSPKAVSLEDMQRMLEEARRSSTRDYAILCFLADTGCRAGGLTSLTLDRLYLDERKAIVVEKGRGGPKERSVYFLQQTANAIRQWLKERPTGTDYVFTTYKGTLLKVNSLRELLERIAKRAGVSGRYNPHAFRHAFARLNLRKGADLSTVSQLMGHSSIKVTAAFYGRWAKSELAQMHDEFSPLKNLSVPEGGKE